MVDSVFEMADMYFRMADYYLTMAECTTFFAKEPVNSPPLVVSFCTCCPLEFQDQKAFFVWSPKPQFCHLIVSQETQARV